ncbi:psbP domain-containing protein 2, chloroplastic [Amaranthus tricolor]|uniref:psbP domain-containing protein 2, chloroplastic n=1 Tax=Amaranthus tricolor TaxID=29722 RepID=UPI00258D9087|nr:psbP domain-containing protein 2, chloroplastic [Amaranthus tricolor]
MALQLKIRPWKKPEEMQQLKDHRFLLIKSLKNHLSSSTQQYPLSQTPKKSQLANIHLPIIPVSHPILVTISSVTKRRTFNFSIFTLILSEFLPVTTINAIADDVKEETKDELEMYVDSEEGFTLLIPSSYMKVEKAGATALFEEENKKANNVGVVVNPVRLRSLKDFGTPQFVAEKLIQAEKRKESTKEAQVIGVAERHGLDGLPVYEFEYRVDSTRGGPKRIFSAAFVSGKKLYLLNITHTDKPENPLDNNTRMMLEKVLHSFDAAPST